MSRSPLRATALSPPGTAERCVEHALELCPNDQEAGMSVSDTIPHWLTSPGDMNFRALLSCHLYGQACSCGQRVPSERSRCASELH